MKAPFLHRFRFHPYRLRFHRFRFTNIDNEFLLKIFYLRVILAEKISQIGQQTIT